MAAAVVREVLEVVRNVPQVKEALGQNMLESRLVRNLMDELITTIKVSNGNRLENSSVKGDLLLSFASLF